MQISEVQVSENYQRALQGYRVQKAEPCSGGMLLSSENETGTGSMRCYDVFPGVLERGSSAVFSVSCRCGDAGS